MDERIKEQVRISKEELSSLYEKAAVDRGRLFDHREVSLGMRLIDLAYETELPKFGVVDITSVKNETVPGKTKLVLGIEEIKAEAIPEFLTSERYPITDDPEVIKKAPWVNVIHAWMKALNEMNTISAMQRGDIPFSVEVIASIAHVLYNFTTTADNDPFIRSDHTFLEKGTYVETLKRESGTEGPNAVRHVCLEEMKYIIEVLRRGFKKD